MRSAVEIVAEAGRAAGGRTATVLRTLRAGGHFAVRETSPGVVHLVGTAAGPLGGDEIDVRVVVLPGARLEVRGVAATVVLPSRRDPASTIRTRLEVGDGGALTFAPEPAIVCAGAVHHAVTHAELAGTARLLLREEVQLGRSDEEPGHWTGRTSAEHDGRAVLRHTLGSAALARDGVRAIATVLVTGPDDDDPAHQDPALREAAVQGSAVRMPLAPGGTLLTGTGPSLRVVRGDLEALDAPVRTHFPALT